MVNYRDYGNANKKVKETYKLMRKNQTVYYVLQMQQKYSNYNLKKSIWEVFEILNDFIDISDPDLYW